MPADLSRPPFSAWDSVNPSAVRVLVTRPAREAQAWVQALQRLGVQAQSLPLIAIGAAPDPQALARRRAALATDAAVMFVSANAVRGFFTAEASPPAWPAGTRAWATGPGTAAALREAGVPASQIDMPPEAGGRFDSESLWVQVASQVQLPTPMARRVLIVRGADADGEVAGRAWLAQQLQAAGVQVDEVAAYRRTLPEWGEATRAQLALAQVGPACWHFSSSEAVVNLERLAPGASWRDALALCTHARIAEAARSAGFGHVAEVLPGPEAVAGFLQWRT